MPTHNPTNAAEIIQAFNTDAVDGDTINLPAGTFDCSGTPLETDQVFNMIGPGSGLCTIICNAKVEPATEHLFPVWRGFTLNCEANNGVAGALLAAYYFQGGHYYFEDVVFEGPCLDDVPIVKVRANATSIVSAVFKKCGFTGSTSDLFVTTGGADTPTNLKSWAKLVDCYAIDRGPGTSDQAYSAHDGVRIDMVRCTYRNSSGVPDARSVIAPGSSPVGGVTPMTAVDCDFWGKVELHKMMGGAITLAAAATFPLGPAMQTGDEPFLFAGITITQGTGGIGISLDGTDSGRIESCLIIGGSRGFTKSGSGNIEVINNRVEGSATGINALATASGEMFLRNNIFNNSTRAIFITAGSTATWDEDYDRSPGSDHITLGPHSFTAAAELNSNGTPEPGGNCDGTGSHQVPYAWVFDLNGGVREKDPASRTLGPIEPPWTVSRKLHEIESGI